MRTDKRPFNYSTNDYITAHSATGGICVNERGFGGFICREGSKMGEQWEAEVVTIFFKRNEWLNSPGNWSIADEVY